MNKTVNAVANAPLPMTPSQQPYGKLRLAYSLATIAVLALLALYGDRFALRFATEVLLIGTAVMSLNLLIGQGGLVSLGHGALFGTAAYSAAVVAQHWGAGLPVVLLAGMATGAILGVLTALISLRTSGLFFLTLSLVFGQLFWELVFRWRDLTGGADGLRSFPKLTWLGLQLSEPLALYLLSIAVAGLSWLALHSFNKAPIGQALIGTRDQPIRMAALGYQLSRIRIAAFLVAGTAAGAAGGLYPFVNQYLSPEIVHWSMSATLIIMGVIGGISTLSGGFIGAAVYLFIQTYLSSYTDRWQLIIGLIFVLTILLMPKGIAYTFRPGRRP